MDKFKSIILIASIIGVTSTFVEFAVTNETMKKQLKMIITMILILGVFLPFIGSDFKISLDSIDSLCEDSKYQDISKGFNEYYLSEASKKVEIELTTKLETQEIYIDKLRIYSRLDEYNSIEITKAEIHTKEIPDDEKDKIRSIISENLPEAEIVFMTEVENETD